MVKYGPGLPIPQPEPPLEEKACLGFPRCYDHERSHKCCVFCANAFRCQERCKYAWKAFTYPRPQDPREFKCSSLKSVPEVVWAMLMNGSDYY